MFKRFQEVGKKVSSSDLGIEKGLGARDHHARTHRAVAAVEVVGELAQDRVGLFALTVGASGDGVAAAQEDDEPVVAEGAQDARQLAEGALRVAVRQRAADVRVAIALGGLDAVDPRLVGLVLAGGAGVLAAEVGGAELGQVAVGAFGFGGLSKTLRALLVSPVVR